MSEAETVERKDVSFAIAHSFTRRTMTRRLSLLSVFVIGLLLAAPMTQSAAAQDVEMEPPGGDYQKVSDLVELPEFVPGLGVLYVQPETLPAGPFLAYDREGELVSSVYMLPLEQLNNQAGFENLGVAGEPVDHVDVQYNPGHPGVDQPHYHVILWYVSPEEAESLQG